MLSLHISKAFDTVKHEAILAALHRMNIDQHFIRYIKKNMEQMSTVIKIGSIKTQVIQIRKGVKQGDPLSPMIFNMVMDELLDYMDTYGEGGYIKTGDNNIRLNIAAFADDIIITAEKESDLFPIFKKTEEFMKRKGMTINIEMPQHPAAKQKDYATN